MLVRPGEQGGIYIVLVDTERNQTLKRIFEMRTIAKDPEHHSLCGNHGSFCWLWQLPDVMNELSALLETHFLQWT